MKQAQHFSAGVIRSTTPEGVVKGKRQKAESEKCKMKNAKLERRI
jgi:hypothetical protein